jgi:hypothetical protein
MTSLGPLVARAVDFSITSPREDSHGWLRTHTPSSIDGDDPPEFANIWKGPEESCDQSE